MRLLASNAPGCEIRLRSKRGVNDVNAEDSVSRSHRWRLGFSLRFGWQHLFLVMLATSWAASSCRIVAQRSPSETLQAAYLAANQGRYSEAEQYLSADVSAAIEKQWENRGGMKAAWDSETRNGAIEKIEILQEDIRGDQATLYFRLHFKDGSTRDDHGPLMKQGSVWKIAPSN